MKYQTLHAYKYNGSNNALSQDEVIAEYQRRLKSPSVWVTNLHPLLTNTRDSQTDKYPIFFCSTTSTLTRIQKINQNSRKIQKLIKSLPGVAERKYTNEVLANEIFFTNKIEGVKTNLNEIKTVVLEEVEKNNRQKQVRLASTVHMYKDIFNQKIIKINNLKDFRSIYDDLLDGEISKTNLPDGKLFRDTKHNVWIGNDFSAIHTPPRNEKLISEKLTELIDFMNNDEFLELPKAIVTHFMFENTHPFYDGNGRTGRYLLSAYLANKIDPYTGLIISTSIHNEQARYYKMFKDAEREDNFADLTIFIEDFLKIIIEGQIDVITGLNDKKERLDVSAKILYNLYPHPDPDKQDLKNSPDHLSNYRHFTYLYILLQSYLYDSDYNQVTDTEITNFLYNKHTRLSSKISTKRTIADLEDKNMIYTTCENPIRHTFSNEMAIKLKLKTK
ncbi:Fic family protein [Lactiplantibacillus pentosus]|uniref:Fic family protein n=1 Tax=Lactiplantibacillus pentosus TaxID=1589 RepID=UPI00207959D3|nr:Fic family protein [Lactiplantibacillus pentosus]USJ86917.1 Fic family protein [Lactiplantibacillus pentosus]